MTNRNRNRGRNNPFVFNGVFPAGVRPVPAPFKPTRAMVRAQARLMATLVRP